MSTAAEKIEYALEILPTGFKEWVDARRAIGWSDEKIVAMLVRLVDEVVSYKRGAK